MSTSFRKSMSITWSRSFTGENQGGRSVAGSKAVPYLITTEVAAHSLPYVCKCHELTWLVGQLKVLPPLFR